MAERVELLAGDYSGGAGTHDGGNSSVIYATSDAVLSDSPTFDLVFEGVSASLFWALLIFVGVMGVVKLRGGGRELKRWPLYLMILAYTVLTCTCESIALAYTYSSQHGFATDSVYLAYIFFWHASSASFLVLLLALSSGYCITRGDLEDHKAKVIGIPAIVFIAGVASDFTFVYVESTQQLSAAADRYNIVQMTAWESAVWFIGSLANIMCFILAWIYIFDSTQLEIKALDEAQQALQNRRAEQSLEDGSEEDVVGAEVLRGRAQRHTNGQEQDTDEEEERNNAATAGGSSRGAAANGRSGGGGRGRRWENKPLGTTSQRTELLYGMEESTTPARGAGGSRAAAAAQAATDLEAQAEPKETETVADHMEYTVRKTLLMRFYIGVCTYLFASIMVVLLPAFFNAQLQNVIVVLQFAVKFLFTVMLAWIFRPSKDSPYLQVGVSDNDADDRGVSALDTELAVTEYTRADRDAARAAQEAEAAAAAAASRRSQAAVGFGPGNAPPQLPVSTSSAAAASGQPRRKGLYASIARAEQPPAPQSGPRFTLDEDD